LAKALQSRPQPDVEQQRLVILFAKLWSSYARPQNEPHQRTATYFDINQSIITKEKLEKVKKL